MILIWCAVLLHRSIKICFFKQHLNLAVILDEQPSCISIVQYPYWFYYRCKQLNIERQE